MLRRTWFCWSIAVLLSVALMFVSGCGGGLIPPQEFQASGIVTDGTGVGIAGVTILFTGGTTGQTTSRADGRWSATGLRGTVVVRPTLDGWTFDPPSRTITGESHSVDFRGFATDSVTVTGRVIDSSGMGLRGALVSIGSSSTYSGPSDPLDPFPSPQEEGYFSLIAPTGNRNLVVSKTGFETRVIPITLYGSQPHSVGNIMLRQDSVTDPGGYTDPNVTVPHFDPDGVASFTVPAPFPDSVSWVIAFPRAEFDHAYDYAIATVPTSGTAMLTRTDAAASAATVSGSTASTAGLRVNQSGLDHQTQSSWRESEADAFRLRDYILSTQHRTRLSVGEYVGHTRDFFVSRLDSSGYNTITAMCLATSDRAAVYADVSSGVSSSDAGDLAVAFDEMYAPLTHAFGTELDVDTNRRVIILLTPLPSSSGTLYGYFSWVNELPDDVAQYYGHRSNECEMIYVNSDLVSFDLHDTKTTIAHEYQHLLHFSERIKNSGREDALLDIWINEGFSLLAQDLAGYGYLQSDPLMTAFVQAWLENHDDWSLIYWGSNDTSYGGSYLFARYLYDHYGNELTLKVNRSAYGGLQAITDVTGGDFGDVFRSFVASIAFAFHQQRSFDPRLGFTCGLNLGDGPIGYLMYTNDSFVVTGNALRPYGVEFFFILGGGSGTEVAVGLETEVLGDYGAVIVEGFTL